MLKATHLCKFDYIVVVYLTSKEKKKEVVMRLAATKHKGNLIELCISFSLVAESRLTALYFVFQNDRE